MLAIIVSMIKYKQDHNLINGGSDPASININTDMQIMKII